MSAAQNTERCRFLRAKILQDHLRESLLDDSRAQNSTGTLNLRSMLMHGVEEVDQAPEDSGVPPKLPGGLTPEDFHRFGQEPTTSLDPSVEASLNKRLDDTLLSITEFYHAETGLNGGELKARASQLADDLHAYVDGLGEQLAEIGGSQERIQAIVEEIGEIHPRLHEHLLDALRKLPPHVHAKRSAQHDFLATTIETSLLKLSLLRARAHSTLYAYSTTLRRNEPEVTIAQALSNAHESLSEEERKLGEEEEELDRQLDEYQRMLELVDGRGHGRYAQVVDDWTRVLRDTEECRRDLRRLGWTEY